MFFDLFQQSQLVAAKEPKELLGVVLERLNQGFDQDQSDGQEHQVSVCSAVVVGAVTGERKNLREKGGKKPEKPAKKAVAVVSGHLHIFDCFKV